MSEFITARRAAALLDIKLPTLYAYVSRGLIRSIPGPGGRPKRYALADVERLKARADARRGHGAVAAGAMRWGEPVLDSQLTEITMDGHRYRGHGALALAPKYSYEQVAELLWTGRPPTTSGAVADPEVRALWVCEPDVEVIRATRRALPDSVSGPDALAVLAPLQAAHITATDPGYGARGESTRADNEALELADVRTLITTMAASLTPAERGMRPPGNSDDGAPGVAERLLWALSSRPAALRQDPRIRTAQGRALNSALILIADHELNASSFTARVAASVGARLTACICAGLATLSGSRHGGMCDRVESFVSECRTPERVADILERARAAGREIPGFGHTLYPQGDPRGRALIGFARDIVRTGASGRRQPSVAWKTLATLVESMAPPEREAPTSDVGLVALSIALGLRPGSAALVFAIGRTVGLVAHALEQRAAGFMLRPRARYVGR